ncbi:phosphatidylserine/phosphatidylglycerophosphate/cardiolipin synthase family protein [Flavobacterium sp. J27]|uniref:phospholipase D-like domain-containing protein n=1 Tax=Flavobacterium sp. J27 TaxID=2060419 RepID=UPI0010319D4D|nr:phospholipase D-like domain-containing protein [Flavobacterium sp. J27]
MNFEVKPTDVLNQGAFINIESQQSSYNFYDYESIYCTHKEDKRLKEEIIEIIDSAETVLKICSFIITDDEIFEVLIDKATSTDVVIFILTQLDAKKMTSRSNHLDFITEEEIAEKPEEKHLSNIKKLYDVGVHIRASVSAHAKFIISDRDKGFITSANLTTPSLNENMESGVYLDENSSQELDILFDIIYQKGTNYTKFLDSSSSNKMFVISSDIDDAFKNLPVPEDSNLRYTFIDEHTNLLEQIIKCINEANLFIYLSTYSIVGLQNIEKFMEAIKTAIQREVVIKIFCRGMNYRNDHVVASQALVELGCDIFANYDNHSKGIVTENEAMIFTANIDGNHGLTNGFEVGYILNDEQYEDFFNFHKELIYNSTHKFAIHPKRIDLFKTFCNYERFKKLKPPTIPQQIIISANKKINIEIEDFKNLPIFYNVSEILTHVTVGQSTYEATFLGNIFSIIKKLPFQYNREKYLLKYDSLILEIK